MAILMTSRSSPYIALLAASLVSGLAVVNIAATAFAADIAVPPTLEQPLPDKKDIPSSVPKVGEGPEVTIIQKEDSTIEEVRVRGKLRYAKVIPKHGKPYYLYDSDGDGILDASVDDVKKADINQWILMEWQ